ncbi:MAG TPA: elongation factor P [Vulgatibacter sp.]|nr:elongation factor P [Vulgatibacter sp.]
MAEMVDTTEFRNGLKIEIDDHPYEIVEFQHVKPGKGAAFVRTKYRSLLTGNTLEKNFRSGDRFVRPDIEEKAMQFLYKEGTDYHFMDQKTFEQTFVPEENLGNAKNFMKENVDVQILFYRGKAIGVTVPNSMDLRIVKCDPGVRGDTVSGAMKPAELETGFVVQVPLFINEGDTIKVDTRTGQYLTRV